jgi:anti-sigma-K factor RskA
VNVKEYISSGIIESYVMGLVTDAEKREFESLAAQYPEIASARNAFELALEEQLLADAKQPPQYLKKAVEEKLSSTTVDTNHTESEDEETPVRSIGIWKWVAVASIILMAGAIYWAVSSNQKYKDSLAKNQDLENRLVEASAQQKELEEMRKQADIMTSSDVKMAAMKGPKNTNMSATVFWDTTGKDVYLLINNMPQPASEKQYQLWAIMNGETINLGSVEVTQKRLLHSMKNVQNAQAFAITIEPKGFNGAKPTSSPVILSNL